MLNLSKKKQILKISPWEIFMVLLMGLFFSSCNQEVSRKRGQFGIAGVGNNKSRVLEVNPIIRSGDQSLMPGQSLIPYLSEPRFITGSNFLNYECMLLNESIEDCFKTYGSNVGPPQQTQSINGQWQFDPNKNGPFWEVNTFYHVKKGIEVFNQGLDFAWGKIYNPMATLTTPPTLPYDLASFGSYWFYDKDKDNRVLRVYALCNIDGNAVFNASNNEICMGFDSEVDEFLMAQDPSVIYHELAHGFVKIMMNQRNLYLSDRISTTAVTDMKSNLGTLFYDEAGALNEGIADFFSYLMNARSHIGEWGLGRLYQASRPMSENDPIHAPGISTAPDSRLRYPTYVLYDPNFPTEGLEGIHHAGQIASHFLYATAEDLKTSCGINHQQMSNWMIMLISETLGEIGDLSTYKTDYYASSNPNASFVNFNQENAFDWTQMVRPPNFKRFFQIFAKNFYHHISHPFTGMCNDGFSKNKLENLLDQYGLLLFDHYNDHLKESNGGPTQQQDLNLFKGQAFAFTPWSENFNFFGNEPTFIDPGNRKQTVMAPKELIDLPSQTDSRAEAIIIDNRAAVQSYIDFLLFSGYNASPTAGLAGTNYNNDNTKFSPGEVVAMALNLVNNSNTIMGGVQVLASDWDHMGSLTPTQGNLRPCTINGFPTVDNGGLNSGDCDASSANPHPRNGDSHLPDASGDYPANSLNPVCFVQRNDNNETRWVNQDLFRQIDLGLTSDTDCLNHDDTANFDPNSCLVRFIPGAQQAFYSKINPQKTWQETQIEEGNPSPSFNFSGVLLMEINKKIPPGTLFNCRLRVRFTNCSNCFYEKDPNNFFSAREYRDDEMTLHTPFKVINFQFRVLD